MNRTIILRAVVILVALSLVVTGGYFVFQWLYRGTVQIDGGDGLSVVIASPSNQLVASGNQRDYNVPPGTYRVEVRSSQGGVVQFVTVGLWSTQKVSAGSASSALYASPVLQSPLYGVIPGKNKTMIGFNPTSESMVIADATGQTSSKISSPEPFNPNLEWDTAISGQIAAYAPYRGQRALVASEGTVYVVSANDVTEIDTEDIPKSAASQTVTIATNPGQDAFVVAFGDTVYRYENVDAKPQNVYTAKKHIDRLAYGGNTLIMYSTAMPDSVEDLRNTYKDYQIDPLLVDLSNQQEQTRPGPVTDATVNPAGKLVTFKPRHDQPYLYSIADHTTTIIDRSTNISPYWTSDTSYLYENNKVLWRYNTEHQQSELVITLDRSISSLTDDGTGGFYATYYYNTATNGVIHLSTTAPPAAATRLEQVTPYDGEGFSITYSSLDTPTVLIETRAVLNNANQLDEFKTQTKALRQAALDHLKSMEVDLTGITIEYSPANL